jgi:hypothetical protein
MGCKFRDFSWTIDGSPLTLGKRAPSSPTRFCWTDSAPSP